MVAKVKLRPIITGLSGLINERNIRTQRSPLFEMVSPVPLPPLSFFTFGRLSASCQATVLKFDMVTENYNKQIGRI
jgi:hypothetical protein